MWCPQIIRSDFFYHGVCHDSTLIPGLFFKRKKASSSSELKQWWESNITMLNSWRLMNEEVRNSVMFCVGTVLMTDIICSVASSEHWTWSKVWRLWSTCCCVAGGFVFVNVLGVWLCHICTSSCFHYFPCLKWGTLLKNLSSAFFLLLLSTADGSSLS